MLSRVWHPDRFADNPDMLRRATSRQQELNDAYRRLVRAYRSGTTPPTAGVTKDSGVAPMPAPAATDPGIARNATRVRLALVVLAAMLASAAGALVIAGIVAGGEVVRSADGSRIRAVAIAAGGGHACAADGLRVACWGRNDVGQTADDARRLTAHREATGRALPDSIVALAAGLVHTCALLRDGAVHCWGGNFAGQLGGGGLLDRAEPAAVTFDAAISTVSSLGRHTCALTSDGSLYCWGDDTDGQLGGGVPVAACRFGGLRFFCSDVPEQVGAGRWRAVAAGGSHSCAIDSAGVLHCWGSNRYGQLGAPANDSCRGPDGATPCRREPAPVTELADHVGPGGEVRTVAAGASHTCALDDEGRALCWGSNTLRQTGTETGDVVSRPTPVGTDLRFTSLVTGAYHSCGLTAAGALYCWGSDVAGELRGRARDRCNDGPCTARPVRLASSGVVTAAAGFGLTCVRRSDGVVQCWGAGDLVSDIAPVSTAEAGSAAAPPGWMSRLAAGVRWRYAMLQGFGRRMVVEPLAQMF